MSAINKININGVVYDIQDKTSGYVTGGDFATKEDIPTKVGQLENDSGFITALVDNLTNYYLKTETYAKSEVDQLINAITTINISVVETRPEVGQSNIIYLVPATSGEEDNYYDEYLYVNDKWEHIGTTKVDLTGYATEEWVNTQIANFLTEAQATEIVTNALSNYYTKEEVDGAIAGIPASILELYIPSSSISGSRVNKEQNPEIFEKIEKFINDVYNNHTTALIRITSDNKEFFGLYTMLSKNFSTFINLYPLITPYSLFSVIGSTDTIYRLQLSVTIENSYVIINTLSVVSENSPLFLNTKGQNDVSYVPTLSSHPATKDYVDTSVAEVGLADYEVPILTIYEDEIDTEENKQIIEKYINKYKKGGFFIKTYNNNWTGKIFRTRNNMENATEIITYLVNRVIDEYPSVNYIKVPEFICTWNNGIATLESVTMTSTPFGGYISTNNTAKYTPTADYHPATKLYVDNTVASALGDVNTVLATLTTVEEVSE